MGLDQACSQQMRIDLQRPPERPLARPASWFSKAKLAMAASTSAAWGLDSSAAWNSFFGVGPIVFLREEQARFVVRRPIRRIQLQVSG